MFRRQISIRSEINRTVDLGFASPGAETEPGLDRELDWNHQWSRPARFGVGMSGLA